MQPLIELKNFPHECTNILKLFEEGKPLSSAQLNFLQRHEKSLSSSTLDPVLKYYLMEHKRHPHKILPLELPKHNLTDAGFQQVKHNIHTLLSHHLSHVDLEMSNEQFLKFKSLGLHEIVFWHGNSLMPGTVFHHGGAPYRLYFQWGRLFGVVKFHILSCGKTVEGKVIIYLENMYERNLLECIKSYSQQLKERQKYDNTQKLIHPPQLEPLARQIKLPRPMPGFLNAFQEED